MPQMMVVNTANENIVKIPRNLYEREKLIYGLDAKQIIYLALGGVTCYPLFESLSIPLIPKIIVTGLAALPFISCAFIKIENEDLDSIIKNFIKCIANDKKLVIKSNAILTKHETIYMSGERRGERVCHSLT